MDILDQIRGDIGGCTAPDVDVDHITADTTLESLGIDSLDRIELVMKIEDRFKIEISHAEARECVSVGGVVKLIEAKAAPDRVAVSAAVPGSGKSKLAETPLS